MNALPELKIGAPIADLLERSAHAPRQARVQIGADGPSIELLVPAGWTRCEAEVPWMPQAGDAIAAFCHPAQPNTRIVIHVAQLDREIGAGEWLLALVCNSGEVLHDRMPHRTVNGRTLECLTATTSDNGTMVRRTKAVRCGKCAFVVEARARSRHYDSVAEELRIAVGSARPTGPSEPVEATESARIGVARRFGFCYPESFVPCGTPSSTRIRLEATADDGSHIATLAVSEEPAVRQPAAALTHRLHALSRRGLRVQGGAILTVPAPDPFDESHAVRSLLWEPRVGELEFVAQSFRSEHGCLLVETIAAPQSRAPICWAIAHTTRRIVVESLALT